MMTLKMTSYPLFLIWILIGTNKCLAQSEGTNTTDAPVLNPADMNRGQSGGGSSKSDEKFDLEIDADFNIPNNGPKTQFNLGVNVGDGEGDRTAGCKSVNGRMVDKDCISYAGNTGSTSTCSSYCRKKGAVTPEPTSLTNFMSNYRTIFPELKGKYFWLSATDTAKERVWKWPSGKILSNTHSSWLSKSYPRKHRTYNCLLAYGSTSISSRAYFHDNRCSSTYYCICQHKL